MQGEYVVVAIAFFIHKVDVDIQVGTFVVEAGANVAFHLVKQIQIVHELVICITPTALQIHERKCNYKAQRIINPTVHRIHAIHLHPMSALDQPVLVGFFNFLSKCTTQTRTKPQPLNQLLATYSGSINIIKKSNNNTEDYLHDNKSIVR